MKLGIVGGLGPLATAYYYELLTQMTDVRFDQDHLEIHIHSCPQIPDRTSYILDHHNQNPLPLLTEIAKGLQDQGVDYITIPCITAHYFHDELTSQLNVPVIHLVEEVCLYLKRKNIDCVGIMATNGTVESQLFQKVLDKYQICYVVPNQSLQEDVMHLIYQNVKVGQSIEMERFQRVSNYLKGEGAQTIILGCTELSIVKKEKHLDESYLDAMELLSAVALTKCHKPLKEEYQYLIDEGENVCKQTY